MNRRHFALLLPAVGLMTACDIDQKLLSRRYALE